MLTLQISARILYLGTFTKDNSMVDFGDIGSIERSIGRLKSALKVAHNEPFLSKLVKYGYDTNHLNEGLSLCRELHNSFQQVQAQFGEKLSHCTKELKQERAAEATYKVTKKIAQIAFAEMPAAKIALHLNREESDWKDEALEFYSELLTDGSLADRMNSYGYRKIRLKDEAEKVSCAVKSEPNEFPQLKLSLELEQEVEIVHGWMNKFISVIKESELSDPAFTELTRDSF